MASGFKFIQDPSRVVKTLSNMEARQMPFAVSLAINQTIDEAVGYNKNRMNKVFDRPTPWTLNGLQRRKTNKKRLPMEGRIEFKLFGGKGTAAYKYLTPQIEGGGRRRKAHERRLEVNGILPAGKMTAPSEGFPLNQYGNITGAEYTKMLAELHSLGEFSATKASRMRKKQTFKPYYVATKNGQPVGIRKRTSKTQSIKMLNFINPPTYQPRWNFYGDNRSFFDRTFRKRISQALAYAIRTAR